MVQNRVRHHVNPLADRTEHRFSGFGNDKPIIVDIGADRGEFSEKLVYLFGEEKNFIVCEIRKPLARKLEKKFESYKNVVVFDGDMVRNFENILKPSVDSNILIEEIYINFPDPWFKERHKKRRIIHKAFLESVQRWISPQTKWIFQTDQKQLFDETVEVLKEIENSELHFFDESPYGYTTKWEDAKVSAGNRIYRVFFYLK
ncbi:MAG: hypothetical protein CR972_03880 [Candidatus Moraniibacteriota bacterium]|nr:MAG: hypothetical protein CR972_03880 [Candidatus Moranbacteria bacterium]